VTVLIDDEAGAVTLSAFDPVRREVAREAMLRLIQDGRIHPTRIEEAVAAVKSEMDETIIRKGEEAAARAGRAVAGSRNREGARQDAFRQSFTQNLLDHSVEVAQLMALMASELGWIVNIARRAGLLHDIGKALSHEVEGPHAIVGADLIKRHGESEAVVNGVASHHNEVPPVGPWGNSGQRGRCGQRVASRRPLREHDHVSETRGRLGEDRQQLQRGGEMFRTAGRARIAGLRHAAERQ
jgi:ribonuclease Y